ncbi:MAG: hypothetical protein L3J93_01765, partial [Thermoplasmata archaeon]|nr:hypothetical protein [Thermoplasmata archaeon]
MGVVAFALLMVAGSLPTASHDGPAKLVNPNGSSLKAALGGSNNTTIANTTTGCVAGICQNYTLPSIYSTGGQAPSEQRHSGASLSGYNGHYWVGAAFAGTNGNSVDVYTSVALPNIGPRYGDWYYEDLAVFDSSSNYDQIGITSNFATGGVGTDDWEVNWVNVGSCGQGTFSLGTNWNPDWTSLNPGGSYTFELKLTGSLITFNLYSGYGTGSTQLLKSFSRSDSASRFLLQGTTTCGGSHYYGYAAYEEVYTTNVQPFPNWDFNFSNNHASGSYVSSWSTFSACSGSGCQIPASPHGYYVHLNPGWALVHIANEAFVILPAALIVYEYPGSFGPLSGALGLVGTYCQATVCGLANATGLPGSGWSISYSVCSSLPCPSTSLSFTVPTGATQVVITMDNGGAGGG